MSLWRDCIDILLEHDHCCTGFAHIEHHLVLFIALLTASSLPPEGRKLSIKLCSPLHLLLQQHPLPPRLLCFNLTLLSLILLLIEVQALFVELHPLFDIVSGHSRLGFCCWLDPSFRASSAVGDASVEGGSTVGRRSFTGARSLLRCTGFDCDRLLGQTACHDDGTWGRLVINLFIDDMLFALPLVYNFRARRRRRFRLPI